MSIIKLDKNDFTISGDCICYKSVPLWKTIATTLNKYNFYMVQEELITIMCEDDLGDCYTYGNFTTLKECMDWLDNPKKLY